jgi:integrase
MAGKDLGLSKPHYFNSPPATYHTSCPVLTVAFSEIGDILKLKLGTHSMRKTRGWAMYSDGVPVEMISKVLNHSTTAVTMRYLGITKEEILQTYVDYEL